MTKFNLLSISKTRPAAVNVGGRHIPYNNEVKTLGLKIKRTGIVSHITERIQMAKIQTNKLKRFTNLNANIKLHLYKALIRPILEYPIIPLALCSDTQKTNMQRVQNKNLKLIVKNEPDLRDKTLKEIHETLNIDPINIRLRTRFMKLWGKIERKEQQLYRYAMNANNDPFRDHNWWPRAATEYEKDDPIPIYS